MGGRRVTLSLLEAPIQDLDARLESIITDLIQSIQKVPDFVEELDTEADLVTLRAQPQWPSIRAKLVESTNS